MAEDIIEKMQKRFQAQQINMGPYAGIDDSEWKEIAIIAETKEGKTLERVQTHIYNWFVWKLAGDSRKAAKNGVHVDSSIIGGILEGIANASIKGLNKEAERRLKDKQDKGDRSTASVSGNSA
jgi:hypothetical protein